MLRANDAFVDHHKAIKKHIIWRRRIDTTYQFSVAKLCVIVYYRAVNYQMFSMPFPKEPIGSWIDLHHDSSTFGCVGVMLLPHEMVAPVDLGLLFLPSHGPTGRTGNIDNWKLRRSIGK